MMASTMTWMGLLSVSRWMISHVLRTISACSACSQHVGGRIPGADLLWQRSWCAGAWYNGAAVVR